MKRFFAALALAAILISVQFCFYRSQRREPHQSDFVVSAVYLYGKKDVMIARQNTGYPDVIFYHLGKDDGVPVKELHIKTDLPVEKPMFLEHLSYTDGDGKYVQDVTVHVHSIYDINVVK